MNTDKKLENLTELESELVKRNYHKREIRIGEAWIGDDLTLIIDEEARKIYTDGNEACDSNTYNAYLSRTEEFISHVSSISDLDYAETLAYENEIKHLNGKIKAYEAMIKVYKYKLSELNKK